MSSFVYFTIGLLGNHDHDQDVLWLPEMRLTMIIGYQGSPVVSIMVTNHCCNALSIVFDNDGPFDSSDIQYSILF